MEAVLILLVFVGVLASIILVCSIINSVKYNSDYGQTVFMAVLFGFILTGIILIGINWHRPIEGTIVEQDGNRVTIQCERHEMDETHNCVTFSNDNRRTEYCNYKKFIWRYLDK